MMSIFLSVVFATLLFVILKLFQKFNIHLLQGLVFNYATAATFGFLMFPEKIDWLKTFQSDWFIFSFCLGFLFIGIFYAVAITTQKKGLSTASVASKMSVVIPILSGLFFFKEKIVWQGMIGLVLALVAIYLTSKKDQQASNAGYNSYPLIVFFGAGTIDALLKIIQTNYLQNDETPLFAAFTFGFAFCIGLLWVLKEVVFEKQKIEGKNIFAGILLGIPNYCSLYFMIAMLKDAYFDSAIIFAVHNIAIVLFSTLIGLIFFKNKLTKINLWGVFAALLAMVFLVFN
jgi:drug/metabolite transporter (DMT)-like permease